MKNIKLFSFLILGLCFSFNAVAMPCGEVPVFCVIKVDHVYNSDADDYYPYYVAKKEEACVPTSYKMGYASPICKATINEEEHYETCKKMYPKTGDQRVVGIAYYTGGDPVNPANEDDKRLWGFFYNKVKIFDKAGTGIALKGLIHRMKACDV